MDLTITDFLSQESTKINLSFLLLDLALAIVLSTGLAKFYIRFGRSYSNRESLSLNFLMITATTTIIISIVKSSLALSLGLVGALSIVRFRTAIKEPEELAYLFFCIAMGLGLGAGQRFATITGFVVVLGVVALKSLRDLKKHPNESLLLNVETNGSGRVIELSEIMSLLEKSTRFAKLRRLDRSQEGMEVSVVTEFTDYQGLEVFQKKLKEMNPSVRVSFLENKTLLQ